VIIMFIRYVPLYAHIYKSHGKNVFVIVFIQRKLIRCRRPRARDIRSIYMRNINYCNKQYEQCKPVIINKILYVDTYESVAYNNQLINNYRCFISGDDYINLENLKYKCI